MKSENVIIHCRAALQDGRNSKVISKDVNFDADVLATFRGPGKEDAFHAWVMTNYPGYVYAPYSGAIKQPADLGRSKPKKATQKKRKKTTAKTKKKLPLLLTILIFPFKLIWWILKGLLVFNKWLDKQ